MNKIKDTRILLNFLCGDEVSFSICPGVGEPCAATEIRATVETEETRYEYFFVPRAQFREADDILRTSKSRRIVDKIYF